ncbi:MAG TPA: ISAs1 family transposase [Ktedonobacteraceae bacterium]|jgi:predicted transposase YbfD/YdcC
MAPSPVLALIEHFAHLDDPHVERTRLHQLLDIVVIAICAVIAGAESWDDIALFGEAKRAWFATFLGLPNGIPSHDTFNRVFAALGPDQFRAGFASWVQAALPRLPPQVIALDGKTMRGSHDRYHGKAAIHIVSAWASASRLVLAQVKVEDKSNEITALPEVLRQLAMSGCVVTIDAMGCQRDIAEQIVTQKANYVLALKATQPDLLEEVVDCFTQAEADAYHQVCHTVAETINKGHGRLEIRRHTLLAEPEYLTWLQEEHHWPGLQALGRVEAERRLGEERTREARYYVLSRAMSAAAFAEVVRSHWGIENAVHWVFDVTFGEDHSRMSGSHAAENMVVLRHLVRNLLEREQSQPSRSLKGKRLKAGWDHDYLLKILACI